MFWYTLWEFYSEMSVPSYFSTHLYRTLLQTSASPSINRTSGLQLMELLIGSGFQFMELPIGSGLLFKLLLIQFLWIYSTGTAAALHRALVILIALYSLFFRLLCELIGLFTENSRVHLQNERHLDFTYRHFYMQWITFDCGL